MRKDRQPRQPSHLAILILSADLADGQYLLRARRVEDQMGRVVPTHRRWWQPWRDDGLTLACFQVHAP